MKAESYNKIQAQIDSILSEENSLIANLANTAAVLRAEFGYWWIGFYLVQGDELMLGPFQGPVACTRIQNGKGVCGTAWVNKATIVVPNVHEFEGHIACSTESNSEIVVPIIKNNEVVAVLDMDSTEFNEFDSKDKEELELLCSKLSRFF